MTDIEKRLDQFEIKVDNLTDAIIKDLNGLIIQINKAFVDHADQANTRFEKFSVYVSNRFDDVDQKLEHIKIDLKDAKGLLSNVEKTGDKVFEMTKLHAYEIPEIVNRLNKLEK